MVHSDFSSPMKTASGSPLPAPTAAPPLEAPSLAGASAADSTEQALNQAPIKPTSNSESTNVSTPTPAKTAISNDSNSTPALSSSQTPTPVQPLVNGRTSGRKRTPKSCDCCGPNSKGHNVQTQSRGRGRARGRARGRGNSNNLEDTPKTTVGGLLTRIKTFDLTKDNLDEAEEDIIGANSRLQISVEQHTPKLDGLKVKGVSTEMKDTLKEQKLIGKEDVCSSNVEMKVLEKIGTEREVVQNCQVTGPTVLTTTTTTTTTDRSADIKRKIEDNNIISSLAHVQALPVVNKQAKIEHVQQTELKPLSENGDSNRSKNGLGSSMRTETIGTTQTGNGPLQTGTDLILIDQTSDKTDSIPLSLSNGNSTSQTDQDTMSMDMKTSQSAAVPAPSHGPISVSSTEHPGAVRDHRLYCRQETWDRVELTEETQEQEGAEGECLEQLVDMVHEFLESFYMKYGSFIPLSETDVVEYLKKKGHSDLIDKGLDIQKEVSRYRAGLASAPVAGFMVTHNKHTLSLEDLGTLEEQNWLNDQIINMYGELIMEATQQKVHFFNSFFHKQLVAKGYEGVKRWTKKIDLFSKWLVLIPIHLEIHWSLVTVSMATKTINYYDSQGIVFRHTTDNILKYLQSEAKEKKQAAFQKGWKITIIKGIPQQKNDSDCGVFVLEYCRCLSVKQALRFSQDDMPRIRKRIYKELCECRLDV